MNITIRDLLDAGVHFGHQLRRYNPKSKEYVFDHRHGISIIDLEKTYALLERATEFITELVSEGKSILLVGTKRQAQEIIREAATQCQMPFCANRWMGGTLTNFSTIKKSVSKYKQYLEMEVDGRLAEMPKKEAASIRREMNRMNRNFEGLLEMPELPAAVFVTDAKFEEIAVVETLRLGIPLIALVDTNSDPTIIDYPIPGNDDSTKSIRIVVEAIMEAIQDGLAQRESLQATTGLTPFIREEAKEEQLPITPIAPIYAGGFHSDAEDIPESYSTDEE
jgi:small subunit ribosomal protein S2